MRKKELPFFVLQTFNVNFNSVADFHVGVVAEIADGNYAVALVAYVYNGLAFVKCNDFTFHNLMLAYFVERLVVGFFFVFLLSGGFYSAFLKSFPIEVFKRRVFDFFHLI